MEAGAVSRAISAVDSESRPGQGMSAEEWVRAVSREVLPITDLAELAWDCVWHVPVAKSGSNGTMNALVASLRDAQVVAATEAPDLAPRITRILADLVARLEPAHIDRAVADLRRLPSMVGHREEAVRVLQCIANAALADPADRASVLDRELTAAWVERTISGRPPITDELAKAAVDAWVMKKGRWAALARALRSLGYLRLRAADELKDDWYRSVERQFCPEGALPSDPQWRRVGEQEPGGAGRPTSAGTVTAVHEPTAGAPMVPLAGSAEAALRRGSDEREATGLPPRAR